GFEDFRRMAKDPSLNQYARIGAPDSYRKGKESDILKDISCKLTNLSKTRKLVLDVGPGCSDLAAMFINFCRKRRHRLLLVDSQEMLDLLPDASFVSKVAA